MNQHSIQCKGNFIYADTNNTIFFWDSYFTNAISVTDFYLETIKD